MFRFPEIQFEKVGVFRYSIMQVAIFTPNNRMKCLAYPVIVTVTGQPDGSLAAEAEYPEGLTFLVNPNDNGIHKKLPSTKQKLLTP
jgi:hypothetical protein